MVHTQYAQNCNMVGEVALKQALPSLSRERKSLPLHGYNCTWISESRAHQLLLYSSVVIFTVDLISSFWRVVVLTPGWP